MSHHHQEDVALDDAELTDGLLGYSAQEVIADFGGHTVSSFRLLLAERGDSMDLMFTYSVISRQGFAYFLPSIDAYARSPESDSDCGLPGSFAHAIKNQLRMNPVAVYEVQDQVESLSKYFLDHLVKFDQGDDWAQKTAGELGDILGNLRRMKSAEQAAT
jgi:hypothetical protein